MTAIQIAGDVRFLRSRSSQMRPAIPIAKTRLATRGGMQRISASSRMKPRSSLGEQEAVNELQRQELVDRGGVVTVTRDVVVHDALDGRRVQIRPFERRRIQQDASNPR